MSSSRSSKPPSSIGAPSLKVVRPIPKDVEAAAKTRKEVEKVSQSTPSTPAISVAQEVKGIPKIEDVGVGPAAESDATQANTAANTAAASENRRPRDLTGYTPESKAVPPTPKQMIAWGDMMPTYDVVRRKKGSRATISSKADRGSRKSGDSQVLDNEVINRDLALEAHKQAALEKPQSKDVEETALEMPGRQTSTKSLASSKKSKDSSPSKKAESAKKEAKSKKAEEKKLAEEKAKKEKEEKEKEEKAKAEAEAKAIAEAEAEEKAKKAKKAEEKKAKAKEAAAEKAAAEAAAAAEKAAEEKKKAETHDDEMSISEKSEAKSDGRPSNARKKAAKKSGAKRYTSDPDADREMGEATSEHSSV
eukprot:Selendium_serpulae@DN4222_c0_g1_i3.p1